jgi:RNA polymerase sigma factor (sigma-70 family)
MSNENDLYKKWLTAPEGKRKGLAEEIYSAVRTHARTVVFKRLPEVRADLPHDIAADVIQRLGAFRGECKFSTWVHEICNRKVNEALRKLIRSKAVFDRTRVVGVQETDAGEPGNMRNHADGITHVDFDRRISLEKACKQLSENHAKLLRYKIEGWSSDEIAAKTGKTRKAVDSQLARLSRKLRKKN